MSARLAYLTLLLALVAATPAAAGEPDATAPAYDVELTGSQQGFRWTGRETIAFTNPGAAPLDVVWIRLWGNGPFGCRGTRHVRISDVAGATPGDPAARCTAFPLRLAAPLAPGARGSVAFDVEISVPDIADRFGHERRVALLSNALPALAHLEGGAWRLDRFFGSGETWTYPTADWTVRLDPPRGIKVAAPGVLREDGSRRLERGRDYSFAAGPMRVRRDRIDGVTVSAWGGREKPVRQLERALRIARNRLPRLVRLYGPYGWPDLQIVLTDAAAMEHTALIMSWASDFVITHELAHEWWYGLVSSDQAEAPWLDEAFASYSEEAAGAQGLPWCRSPGAYARLVTRPVDFFRSRLIDYGNAVYAEGACLLDVLGRRMGKARFRAALRAYVDANRYGWSTAAEFRAAMDAASPVSLAALWRRYRVQ
jgi:hypothetical protein